ncbi:MAG: GNAT family N-acetyltransferase [Pseudomonadota bacterium]
MNQNLQFKVEKLAQLSALEVHETYALRQQVFILEQTCLYPDIDQLDLVCWHLLGFGSDGDLAAYLRIIPPSGKYAEPALGRIATSGQHRGAGHGKAVVARGIEETRTRFPGAGIRISAQTYLTKFYREFGFETVGSPYLEDDIEHIEMLLPASA